MFLTTSSRRREEMGAAKVSVGSLKGHDQDTAKKTKQKKNPTNPRIGRGRYQQQLHTPS